MKNRTAYVRYNNKSEIAYLDKNTFNAARASVFPAHLYSGDAIAAATYVTGGEMRNPDTRYLPRDTRTHYIIDVERDQHPDNFSRFGYARAPYGYITGQRPGKYDDEPWVNCSSFQPNDMAPSRFYTEAFSGQNSILTQAQLDYKSMMKG